MIKRQQILIFGGGFSPPTLAHEAIVRVCLALPEFDEVWTMPSGDRLDKQVAFRDAARMDMLRLARAASFANDPRLVVSDFELKLPRPSQTYSTVEALREAFPHAEFTFVFGADSYESMPSWPRGAELQESLSMVVFGSARRNLPANVRYIQIIEYADISSTQARAALAKGKSLAGMVSPAIADYLAANVTAESRAQLSTE